jgi:hypothetical protein
LQALNQHTSNSFVNQHAKITWERVESTLKFFHPNCVMILHFVGVAWGDFNGSCEKRRKQAASGGRFFWILFFGQAKESIPPASAGTGI